MAKAVAVGICKVTWATVFYLGKFVLGAVVCTLSPLLYLVIVLTYLAKRAAVSF